MTPVAVLIANWPPSLPFVIWKLFPAIASPDVATVTRLEPDAVPSATVPV